MHGCKLRFRLSIVEFMENLAFFSSNPQIFIWLVNGA